MKTLKVLALLTLFIGEVATANSQFEGIYDLHLHFGEGKSFVDVLTLAIGENNELKGHMHVPNDFDADLEGITVENSNGRDKLSFFIALPEKYHATFGRRLFYELHFLPHSPFTIEYNNQFIGFVTHHRIEYRPTYVGSIIGFKNKNTSNE